MNDQLYLFIIWEKSRHKSDLIIDDIKSINKTVIANHHGKTSSKLLFIERKTSSKGITFVMTFLGEV